MAYPNGMSQNEKYFLPINSEIDKEFKKIYSKVSNRTSPNESFGKLRKNNIIWHGFYNNTNVSTTF